MNNPFSWHQSLQSRFLALKNNQLFELFVVAIIILSALMIGAQTYDIKPIYLDILKYVDLSISLFFVVEIIIRFLAEPKKSHFFKSGWNIFDLIIVTISLIPIDDAEMVVLARLIRIFRVLRMISVIPELRVLLNSLIKALPQLGYVIMLMFIIFYIYAAVGSTLFVTANEALWGDISISMLTLFRIMTFEDWTDVMYETMDKIHPLSWIYYISFIFLTTFAFLNMVIGIVVNVMEEESRKEYDKLHKNDPNIIDVYNELQSLKAMIKNNKE